MASIWDHDFALDHSDFSFPNDFNGAIEHFQFATSVFFK